MTPLLSLFGPVTAPPPGHLMSAVAVFIGCAGLVKLGLYVRGGGRPPFPNLLAVSGTYFVKAFNQPTVTGTLIGKMAGAILSTFTKVKAIYDFSAYAAGLVACR